MPTVLLPVPLLSQSDKATCLPACARMVLAFLGQDASESLLVNLLGTDVAAGTPFSRIQRLARRNYRVTYGPLDEATLRATIAGGYPVLVQLRTFMLDYWLPEDTSHAAVVVGYDDRYVYLNDPAFSEAPQRVLWDGFLAAWEEYDRIAAIIQPSAR